MFLFGNIVCLHKSPGRALTSGKKIPGHPIKFPMGVVSDQIEI